MEVMDRNVVVLIKCQVGINTDFDPQYSSLVIHHYHNPSRFIIIAEKNQSYRGRNGRKIFRAQWERALWEEGVMGQKYLEGVMGGGHNGTSVYWV